MALFQRREAEGRSSPGARNESADRSHRDLSRIGRYRAASIVLLDECWALLESPILASVVVQLFRTARKRNASVWGISQTPEDFVGTPDRPNEHGAGIVKNATTKIIGKHRET